MSRFGLTALLLLAFSHTTAAVVTVDTSTDGDDGECLVDCSIREAVDTALTGDSIVVPAGTYTVSLGAILIDRDLTIVGDGALVTVIRASVTPERIFIIDSGISAEISAVSLSLLPGPRNGGGIRNDGELVLRDCWLRDSFNPLDLGGGALRNTPTGTATVQRCTLSNNIAEFGGAVFNEGVLFLDSTTVTGNSNAFFGGGIANSGGAVTLSNSTVTGNVALFAGAGNIESFGSFVIRNTVVSDAVGGPDCAGNIDALDGHNLDGDGTCVVSGGPGNLTAAAQLEPLADNGGPVPTHAPAVGSPLIDAGNPASPGSGGNACAAEDARGVARPQGAVCDIGAFELALGQGCPGGTADDADGDGLCRPDDNCPTGFNPHQGSAIFPSTMVAMGADRFSWGQTTVVAFARGELDQVDAYGTNDVGELTGTDSLFDDEIPMVGSGFYYVVRLGGECTVSSWQTRLGGEPGRDEALP